MLMEFCCPEFRKAATLGNQEGFWIGRITVAPPRPAKILTFLRYQTDAETHTPLTRINFCPWCGRELESSADDI